MSISIAATKGENVCMYGLTRVFLHEEIFHFQQGGREGGGVANVPLLPQGGGGSLWLAVAVLPSKDKLRSFRLLFVLTLYVGTFANDGIPYSL